MIFDAARLAFQNLFAAETRSVFWKVLGLTLLVLAALWFAIRSIFIYFALPWIDALIPGVPDWAGWLSFVFAIFAGIGLALALALLISPVTAVIAGLFLDDVAEVVEKKELSGRSARQGDADGRGRALLHQVFRRCHCRQPHCAFSAACSRYQPHRVFLVNGYLLGREFFEFAAMRFRSPADARLFRVKHRTTVFMAGLVIAAFLAVPFLNLLTPLFAASMMVHLHKAVSRRDPSFAASRTEQLRG